MARRWDENVRDRFKKLLVELGKEFDGKIEGVNLAETAYDIGDTGALFPKDFTFEKYRDGIIANMQSLRQAFPKSVVLVYANFKTILRWNKSDFFGIAVGLLADRVSAG